MPALRSFDCMRDKALPRVRSARASSFPPRPIRAAAAAMALRTPDTGSTLRNVEGLSHFRCLLMQTQPPIPRSNGKPWSEGINTPHGRKRGHQCTAPCTTNNNACAHGNARLDFNGRHTGAPGRHLKVSHSMSHSHHLLHLSLQATKQGCHAQYQPGTSNYCVCTHGTPNAPGA